MHRIVLDMAIYDENVPTQSKLLQNKLKTITKNYNTLSNVIVPL